MKLKSNLTTTNKTMDRKEFMLYETGYLIYLVLCLKRRKLVHMIVAALSTALP